jgi:hypothetical protein
MSIANGAAVACRRFQRAMGGLALTGCLFSAPSLLAEEDSKAKTPVAAADSDSQEEAAALKFAKAHHPELARLLGPMKASRPKEYQKAVRELFRVSDRLGRMETRFPERYALELDLWKAESHLRLVAAKSAMVDDDERREQIEKLVTQRNSLKIQLFEYERGEAEAKIAQLNKQIAALKTQQDEGPQKEVDRLVNTAKSSAKRVKTKLDKPTDAGKPAAKPKT